MNDQKYRPSDDINTVEIRDIVPNKVLRAYVYEFPNAENSKEFVGSQTVSSAYISQTKLAGHKFLKLDEVNNKYYFDVFAAITSDAKLDVSTSTSTLGQELKEENTMTIISNWNYSGELKDLKIGRDNLIPTMITIGIPYNERLYRGEILEAGWYKWQGGTSSWPIDRNDEIIPRLSDNDSSKFDAIFLNTNQRERVNGDTLINPEGNNERYEYIKETKQPVYLVTSTTEGREFKENKESLNPKGLYQMELANIALLEASYPNSIVIPTENLNTMGGLAFDSKDGNYKNGFTMDVESNSLVNKIIAKGSYNIQQRIDSEIDLVVSGNYTPLKMTPIATQDKVTLFASWWDYDFVMPLFIAEKFLTSHSLNTLISDRETREVLEDMLALSYAFASNFSDFIRITDTSNSSYGKINPNQTIGNQVNEDGTKGIKVTSIEGANPVTVIDGIYERYIRTVDEKSEKVKLLKIAICALSRYIYSTYAIGKGQNSYNQAYLPFYFTPSLSKPIAISSKAENPGTDSEYNHFTLDTIEIETKSEWFDVDRHGITPKTQEDISNVKLISTDRKLTIPELPSIVQPLTKLLLPGDINTQSSDPLAYTFYIPFDNENTFKNIFLNSSTIEVDNNGQNLSITASIDSNQESQTKINQTLINAAAKIQGIPNNEINFNNDATISKRIDVWHSLPKNQKTQTRGVQGVETIKIVTKWNEFTLPNGQIFRNNKDGYPLSNSKDEIKKELVALLDKYYKGLYEIQNIVYTNKDTSNRGWFLENFDIRFFTFEAAGTYKTTSQKIKLSFDTRQTLFDKINWKNFLTDIGALTTNYHTFELSEERGKIIDKIDEIVIYQLWGNEIILNMNNNKIKIPLFNATDETISEQRIIFT